MKRLSTATAAFLMTLLFAIPTESQAFFGFFGGGFSFGFGSGWGWGGPGYWYRPWYHRWHHPYRYRYGPWWRRHYGMYPHYGFAPLYYPTVPSLPAVTAPEEVKEK